MAGTGLVAGEVVVDALPYFDQGYEAPGVREAVSAGRLCSRLLSLAVPVPHEADSGPAYPGSRSPS
jgi:hypothetical protein